jgi:hypothetical protein
MEAEGAAGSARGDRGEDGDGVGVGVGGEIRGTRRSQQMNRHGRRRRRPRQVYKWAHKVRELTKDGSVHRALISLSRRARTRRSRLSPTRPNNLLASASASVPTPRSEAALLPLPLRAREDETRQQATGERPRTMMACRRLAREAVAASLRRGSATAPTASTRAFSAAAAAAASCSSRAPVAASPIRQFLARCSSPAFQPRAAEFGPSLTARVALGLRPQLSGEWSR